jgi:hypothetical protein
MADYRNTPFKFALGGLNLVDPPDSLNNGQLTRALNLRANVEGVIEARPATGAFEIPQKAMNGYTTPYPSLWGVGPLRAIRYYGNCTTASGTQAGYITIHAATPRQSGYSDGYARTFINGSPVMVKSSHTAESPPAGWPTSASKYGALLDPTGVSILFANAPNGIPIILVDGQYWIAVKDCNLTAPSATGSYWNTGSATLNSVPIIYAYLLGIDKPNAPTTSLAAGAAITGTYYYAATYLNSKTDFESPLSDPSGAVVCSLNKVTVTIAKTTQGAVDKIRVWRKGGAIPNSWRLITTLDNDGTAGNMTCDDEALDVNVALNESIDGSLVKVFSTINVDGTGITSKFPYTFGPFLGKYIFSVGDPVRKNFIYWNHYLDMGKHHPLTNVASIGDSSEELLNGFLFGNTPIVFSNRKFISLEFTGVPGASEFIPRELPYGMGCSGRWAFAVGPNAFFFLSKDGIYASDGQPAKPTSITDATLRPIFRGMHVGDLEPLDYSRVDQVRLHVTNKELHFIYPGTSSSGNMFHLIFDLDSGRWLEWTPNRISSVYYNEGQSWSQLLLGDVGGPNIWDFNDVFENINEAFPCQFRSGSWDAGIPLTHKEFGVLMLDFDPNGANLKVIPYYDNEGVTGTTLYTDTTGDRSGRRVKTFSLGDVYAKNIGIDITWNEDPSSHPKLYQAILLFREDEESIVHWEHPEQSMGIPGLYHIKESYWGLRSTADVILTVTTDGRSEKYTLPSTSGARSKVFCEFLPVVGKHWGFKLDSTQPFRFYGEDTVLYSKPWRQESSYQTLSPFTTVGYANFNRTMGGT